MTTIAEQLRKLADQLDPTISCEWVTIHIQPDDHATVDRIGQSLWGRDGEIKLMGNGNRHHDVNGITPAGVRVHAYCQWQEPAEDKRERLSRELAALDEQIGAPA